MSSSSLFVRSSQRPAVKGLDVKIRCRLQDFLDERHLSRNALKQETGLTAGAIRGLCENTVSRYDVKTLAVLCRFFACDVGDLLEKVPTP